MAKANKNLQAIVTIAGTVNPSLSSAIQSATKQIGGMQIAGVAAAAAVTAAAVAAAKFTKAAVESASTFQKEMSNVSTLLDGDIAKRVNELSDDVLDISNRLNVDTSDLTDGLYQVISAYEDSAEAAKQLEITAMAGRAGNATTAESLALLSAVTKGYGDTSAEAQQKAADLAFQTLKLGQTSFPELASSIGKVIPLSSALGMEQEELFGAFATLTGVTGGTAEVATQLQGVLQGFLAPSSDMTKAIQSLGYESGQAMLQAEGFQGSLELLKESVQGNDLELTKLFGRVQARTAVLSMAGAQSDSLTRKTMAMYEATGMTSEAFAAQTNNLSYMVSAMQNLGKNFLTTVGMQIVPLLTDAMRDILPTLSAVMPQLAGAIGGLFTALEPLLPVLGEMVTTILPVLVELIVAVTPAIAGAIRMAALFLRLLLRMVQAVLPALSTWLKGIGGAFKVLGFMMEAYAKAWEMYVVPLIEMGITYLSKFLQFLTYVFLADWGAAWEAAKNMFAYVWQSLYGIVKGPFDAIVALINRAIAAVNSVSLTMPDWVPVVGGRTYTPNIPPLPMFARGGFTNGPSIAGEAAREAVISFDPAYRQENLSHWARAGRMLGALGPDVKESEIFSTSSSYQGGDVNIVFAPTLHVEGKADEESLMQKLKALGPEFVDYVMNEIERRGGSGYGGANSAVY